MSATSKAITITVASTLFVLSPFALQHNNFIAQEVGATYLYPGLAQPNLDDTAIPCLVLGHPLTFNCLLPCDLP